MSRWRQFVVWGFLNSYHTHSHIHEGFVRGLRHMFPDRPVHWLDGSSDLAGFDWSGSFIITNHDVSLQLPARPDCFYMVHGGSDSAACKEKFWGLKGHMSWNVFIDWSYAYDDSFPFGRRPLNRPEAVWVGEDAPFYPGQRHMDFRWATDLTPDEVRANKAAARPWNPESRAINYVGSYWHVNEREISEFGRACWDGGVLLRHMGAGQADEGYRHLGRSKVVSPEDNIRLVRESYFAPAIVGSHHLTEGYAPCRIFKNISYGRFGVTNSEKVQRLFGGRLICNPDPYGLFFEARDRLPSVTTEQLHELMEHVAERHTYVNRLEAVLKAAEMVMEEA